MPPVHSPLLHPPSPPFAKYTLFFLFVRSAFSPQHPQRRTVFHSLLLPLSPSPPQLSLYPCTRPSPASPIFLFHPVAGFSVYLRLNRPPRRKLREQFSSSFPCTRDPPASPFYFYARYLSPSTLPWLTLQKLSQCCHPSAVRPWPRGPRRQMIPGTTFLPRAYGARTRERGFGRYTVGDSPREKTTAKAASKKGQLLLSPAPVPLFLKLSDPAGFRS